MTETIAAEGTDGTTMIATIGGTVMDDADATIAEIEMIGMSDSTVETVQNGWTATPKTEVNAPSFLLPLRRS
jgi:hypothetical protein